MEGATCLLEAGVVSGLAESERMKTASEIATTASKLGALGSETAAGGDPVNDSCSIYLFFRLLPCRTISIL